MTDWIVRNMMRATVMTLIAALGVAAIYLGYSGMLAFFAQRWSDAPPAVLGSIAVAICVYLLAYHRGDLVY